MDKKILVEALLQLKSESMSIQNNITEDNFRSLMRKHGMLFLGEKINIIYSNELWHMLKTKHGIDAPMEEVNSIIPEVCFELGMKAEPLVLLKDAALPDAPISNYQITLF